jgi:hypothetical protein
VSVCEFEDLPGLLVVLKRQRGASISPKEMETAVIPGNYKFVKWLSADRYMATEQEGIAPMKAFSRQDGVSFASSKRGPSCSMVR